MTVGFDVRPAIRHETGVGRYLYPMEEGGTDDVANQVGDQQTSRSGKH